MSNRRVFGLVVALAWLCALVGPGAMPVAASSADDLGAALQSVIDQKRVSLRVPGVTAAVIFGDGSRWTGVSGSASLSPERPVTADTPFVVGSITKTVVAALILDLAEEDLLSIEDPLSTWLPDYPNAANITVRQLLSHTSGLYNYFRHVDFDDRVFGNPSHQWTPTEILDEFEHEPYFAPGTGFQYSNTNFILLGLIAEQAGGATVGELLRARFWDPMGLANTSIQSAGPPPAATARGHLLANGEVRDVGDDSGYRPTLSAASVTWSVGDLVATAGDIATWINALYSGDVLEPASLTDMMDWERYPGGDDYGLGTRTQVYDGMRMFGHRGSVRGYVAAAWYIPSEDATVVVLTNRGGTDSHIALSFALMNAAFAELPPSVPSGLTATAQGHRYVQLTWNAASDSEPGTTYRLLRNGYGIGERMTELSYLDRTPKVGTYRYQVRAIDPAGNKSGKSPPVSVWVTR